MMRLYYADIAPLKERTCFERNLDLVNRQRTAKVLSCRNEEDRCRSLAAGLLLKAGLTECGVDYEKAAFMETDHGKPCFAAGELHFSISHGGQLAACALAERPIGIDVERVGRFSGGQALCTGRRIAGKAFSHEERRALEESEHPAELFAQIWTRKEACAKAVGLGLAMDFREIDTMKNDYITIELLKNYLCSIYPQGCGVFVMKRLSLADMCVLEQEEREVGYER